MKVVLITPNFHQARGNTITVQRIAYKLEKLNVKTEIVSLTDTHKVPALPKADLYHGFNAYRFYQYKKDIQKEISPYIVTMTGTDLNHDLFDENKRQDVICSVTEAEAVHVFNEEAKHILIREVPSINDKVYVIPQDVNEFEDIDFPKLKNENDFLFILPAGIRRIKNIPFAIESLKILQSKYPHVRLAIVGPIIEKTEGRKVLKLIEENKSWIQYLNEVPHRQMGAIYKQSDALLNTSLSEGQSTAIMEGMAARLPVLVSNNHGNCSIVTHEKTGLIFNDQDDFIKYAEQLFTQIDKRNELGKAAQEYILKQHANSQEGEEFVQIYKNILNKKSNYDHSFAKKGG